MGGLGTILVGSSLTLLTNKKVLAIFTKIFLSGERVKGVVEKKLDQVTRAPSGGRSGSSFFWPPLNTAL